MQSMDARTLPAAGWFPDPLNPAAHRYWNGRHWTDYVQHPGVHAGGVLGSTMQSLHMGHQAQIGLGSAHAYSHQRSGASRIAIALVVVALAACVIVGAVAALGGSDELERLTGARTHAPAAAAATTFSTPSGSVSVKLPSKPKHEHHELEVFAGMKAGLDMYTVTSGRGEHANVYAVQEIDMGGMVDDLARVYRGMPRAAIRTELVSSATSTPMFDNFQSSMAAESKGTVSSSKDVTVNGMPARQAQIAYPGKATADVLCIYDTKRLRMYALAVISRSGSRTAYRTTLDTLKLNGVTAEVASIA